LHVEAAAADDVDARLARDSPQRVDLPPHVRVAAVDDAADAFLRSKPRFFDHQIDVVGEARRGANRPDVGEVLVKERRPAGERVRGEIRQERANDCAAHEGLRRGAEGAGDAGAQQLDGLSTVHDSSDCRRGGSEDPPYGYPYGALARSFTADDSIFAFA